MKLALCLLGGGAMGAMFQIGALAALRGDHAADAIGAHIAAAGVDVKGGGLVLARGVAAGNRADPVGDSDVEVALVVVAALVVQVLASPGGDGLSREVHGVRDGRGE